MARTVRYTVSQVKAPATAPLSSFVMQVSKICRRPYLPVTASKAQTPGAPGNCVIEQHLAALGHEPINVFRMRGEVANNHARDRKSVG